MSVAIVGLGQIGSSLGAALVARRLDARVIGIARRRENARRALALRCAHETTTRLDAAREADIVVLAAPVRAILDLIPRVRLKSGALLTDVGSTKADAMRAARRVPFIGGHPMAGTEKHGLDGCNAKLFAGRPWILIPGRGVLPVHVERLGRLVAGVGARAVWMEDADAHDATIAAVSHVPHLVAYALALTAGDRASLAGGSFRDATRVAASPPDMVLDFLLTNRAHVARATDDFVRTLKRLAAAVRRGDEKALRRTMQSIRRSGSV